MSFNHLSCRRAKNGIVGKDNSSSRMRDMSLETTAPAENTVTTPALGYARFSRRLRAFLIDWFIFLVVIVGALFVAVILESDDLNRKLGFAVVVVLLLYEPLLVSLTGSSIGHYLTNLRVVDNRRHGNVSFLKAVVRTVVKTVLGWYSFITMATTLRHQALHDLLTQSTVQIRTPSMASPNHYVGERWELLDPALPSRLRRVAVIFLYLLATFIILALTTVALLSRDCVLKDHCTASENILNYCLSFGWLAVGLLSIVQGWRGRLLGCRARRST
jgi:uncharacterized RDD family membrane protein YckC